MAKEMKVPTCSDSGTFKLWVAEARRVGGLNAKTGFCIDCLPDFKRKHMRAGTCNSPQIKFRVDADGFIEGYAPGKIELLRMAKNAA